MNLITTNQQGFAPVTLDEAMRFSDMLAKSSMVPKAYQGKPEDVLVAVQWGKELGLAPLQALQNIACINGKPSVYGDAAMALVQASPVCEGIEEYFEGEGTPNPVAVCVAHRKNRQPVTAKFSVEDAKRAGLWGKQGPWQAYPKRMLQMRARGFALRDAFPDVLKGLITAEEAADYPSEAKDITPRAVLRNPLDSIGKERHPGEVLPAPESPIVIAPDLDEVNAQLSEISKPEEVDHVISMAEDIPAEAVAKTKGDWELRIPGKGSEYYPDYPSWSEAYKKMADKVLKATKLPNRDRLNKLKELRDVNMPTFDKVDTIERVNHTAAFSKRLAQLEGKV
jgi:hypothetical protein